VRAQFLIGTSGWNYPHWRGVFYPRDVPPRAWLAYYARRFPTVEINYSFYRLPTARMFAAWRAAVPAAFTFAVKASRFITHIKRLRTSRGPVGRLLTRARPLRRRLGPILFQLPPTFACDEGRLAHFLRGLPSGHRYAVEFRHLSWHREPVYRLLRRHRVACCVSDGPDIPLRLVKTSPFVYVRLHGPEDVGAGRYSEAALRSWARDIRALSGTGTAYVYFNNDERGFAIENAARLTDLLGG
jgi:uncharacterized protein YecE (DUF72 family)